MSVYPLVLNNDSFVDKESLVFPFEERGLQFGDGVYEVIRVYKGNYYLFYQHINRLFRSLDKVNIQLSVDKNTLAKQLIHLLEKNQVKNDAIVYLQVSRGSAPREHTYPTGTKPNMYAYVRDTPRNKNSLTNGTSAITLPDERWTNCHIKSLNLLPNVMAKQTAKEFGSTEAILYKGNKVTEGSASNIFIVKNNEIHTHPTNKEILNGCVRMAVKRFSNKQNVPFNEIAFTLEDLMSADEVFSTSSTAEVTPIVQIDGQPIKTGNPGSLTRMMQKAYNLDAGINTANE